MTGMTQPHARGARSMFSKVPEVTVWFWIIKILCTTVGESFADWINMTLGVGLATTAVLFTAVLAAVLAWQLWLNHYVPLVYWLTVVVVSVTGTLYTDILTDSLHVPLAVSTTVMAVMLVVVFGIWFVRERTLSIHSIVSLPRELFYWLAVLVTFALGTAAGDWTLEVTGWGPGTSVLLPAILIAAVALGWRLGANAVLSFWLAYILTRPLGANLGDWLASPTSEHGLGVGTAWTSIVFLAAIVATVVYLTITRRDVIDAGPSPAPAATARRERIMLGFYLVVAVLAGAVVTWASAQPHTAQAAASDEDAAPAAAEPADPAQVRRHFPPAEIDKFGVIAHDALNLVHAGRQTDAKARVKDLETAWDQDQDVLQPMDASSWKILDTRIDVVLSTIRAPHPDNAAEVQALNSLITALK